LIFVQSPAPPARNILYLVRLFWRGVEHHAAYAIVLPGRINKLKIKFLTLLPPPDCAAIADIKNIVVNGVAADIPPSIFTHTVFIQHLNNKACTADPEHFCLQAFIRRFIAAQINVRQEQHEAKRFCNQYHSLGVLFSVK
jgi:hypothetical protein